MKIFFLLLCICSLCINSRSLAQSSGKFRSTGALYGYGPEFSDNIDYKIYFVVSDISQSFRTPHKKVFLGWYMEPQFNFVKTNTTPTGDIDFEVGVNLGLRNYIKLSNGFYFYQMLGSGPHYVSAKMERQANGFIFSDNLALGGLIDLKKKLFGFPIWLNLQTGVRHISNAILKLPNRGVNSYVFRAGLSYVR